MLSNLATSGYIVGLHILFWWITNNTSLDWWFFYWNTNKLNDGYVLPRVMDLFRTNNNIYTIVAWIFVNEIKWCSLGGLVVKPWYILVIGHYQHIISSFNISLSWLSPKVKKVWNVCKLVQGGGKCCNMVGILICHFMWRYSY